MKRYQFTYEAEDPKEGMTLAEMEEFVKEVKAEELENVSIKVTAGFSQQIKKLEAKG